MEFKTYVNIKYSQSDVADAKERLLAAVDEAAAQGEESRERLTAVRAALKNSGNSHFAGRYGLEEGITFADSEIIIAVERNRDAVKYLLYRYDFKYYPHRRKLRRFPLVVAVEASSLCNLRCGMCFQGNMDLQETRQNRGIMEYGVYEKFLFELEKNSLYSIVFASRGEPLLNPNIDRMISEAKKRGVLDIKLNTNAVLLTEELSRRLLASGLDMIVFSVDSVDSETYRRIRGADLNAVKHNIDRFLRIRIEEFPKSGITTRVAMVMTKQMLPYAHQEVEAAKQYWLNRVDELSVKTENDFAAVYDEDVEVPEKQACSLLWERVYLWHDGRINPCDIDHLSTMCVGDITKGDTIEDVWRGEKLERLREIHVKHRQHCSGVCGRCVGY